jgi:hypothetical protein
MKRATRALAAIAVFVVALPSRPSAHDIPADTTVRMFIKPDGQRLHMLVRVQMASINDIDWPMHKNGYLDLPRIDPFLRDAATMWISDYIDVYEGSRKISFPEVASVRLATDGDPSFEDTYDAAVAHLTGPRIPDDTNLFPLQGLLDVMFDYPIESPESNFSITPRFDRLGLHVTTVLKFVRPNGALRSFEYAGLPGLVRLDPQWHEAAWRFMQIGFFHFLDASAPLLFLLCLVLPFRRVRGLIPVVTAFAVAHSVTLVASAAYHMEPDSLWFPPLVSTLLAVSIFYVALENIVGLRAEGRDPTRKTLARRWMVALAFGLVHGFAFAFALGSMLQFAGSHATVSIVSFNLGIEVGLIFVLALMVPAVELLFRFVVDERIGTIVLSAIVAHTAWHTMADRYAELRRYPFRWPALDLLFLASALRWMMVAVVLAAAVWLIGLLRDRVAPDGTQLTRGFISRSQK